MKKVLCYLLFMAFGTLSMFGQARLVTGVVSSAEDGSPLPGVTVAAKGTTIGTITDASGNYQINVPEGIDVLIFSFVGLATQEVGIGNMSEVLVNMESDLLEIDEVVVTAMGIRKEKKALGYSVQEINESQISGAKNMDVSKSLQGKIAGVNVKQSSGMPGATSHVTIRGNVSLTGSNQPLYVVDGMPIASEKAFTENVGEGTNPSSRIVDLNPEDIESITVLKGATASALYGLRAANGVILITTKSGSAARASGKKTLVTLNTNFTSDRISRLPELQSTYAQGNGGLLGLWSSGSWGPRIDTLQNYQSQEENLYFDNPYETFDGSPATQVPKIYDNQEDFFQKGYTFTNSVDISSATDRSNFSLGFGRTDQKGIIETTGMTRNNMKFNGNFALSDKWSASISANVSNVDIDKIPGGSNLANPLFTIYSAPRTYDLTNKPYYHESNPYTQYHYRFAMDNPYWALANSSYNEITNRFFGNTAISYEPFDWMRINYRIGLDRFLTTGHEVISLGSGGAGRAYPEFGMFDPAGGQIDDYTHQRQELNSNLTINITKDFGDFGLDVILGNEFYDITTQTQSMTGTNITIGGFDHISNTGAQTVFQELTSQRVVGFYGSATADYASMIFLTVTGRNDIVSNMPSGNRSYFYPSVSAGFIFTELGGLKNQNVLPYGKIRAAYSQMGQAGALYATRTLFTEKTDNEGLGSGFLQNDFTFPYQGYPAFTLQSTLLSNQLRPQNITTYEFGVDLRFYENRVGIDYSYYYVNATDQIFNVPLASSSGFRGEYRNAGELESKGHEIVLSIVPVRTSSGFEWEILGNFSANQNMVISLAPGVERVQTGWQNFNSVGAFAYAGHPYPVIFGSGWLRDENDRVVVDSRQTIAGEENPYYGMPLQGDEKILGKVNPDWDAGLTNTFRYKGFTLMAQLFYSRGGFISSGMNGLLRNYGADKITEDRETPVVIPDAAKGYVDPATGDLVLEGDNDIEILKGEDYYSTVEWNCAEAKIFDKTLLRLKEVVISYDMPQSWFNNSFINNISVYITGRNLALWTDYPNFDPESSTAEGNGIGAFEYVSLPNTRSFGGGLRLTF